MIAAVSGHALTLQMTTPLVRNCFDGVSEEDARHRLNEHTNSMAFLLLHMLDARHYLLRYLGGEADNPFEHVGKDAKTIDDIPELPAVEPLLEAWDTVAAALLDHMNNLTDEDLTQPTTAQFPVGDTTILGGLTFLVSHESYHLGQLGLLRKERGLGPMSYA